MRFFENIPDVEWWDVPLLKGKDDDAANSYERGFDEELIDSVIHHPPIPKQYAAHAEENRKDVPPPEFLTEEEKRRSRRRRNEEKQKQKQEMVTLGLAPPPEDRCRFLLSRHFSN
jgi:hypothetical protein